MVQCATASRIGGPRCCCALAGPLPVAYRLIGQTRGGIMLRQEFRGLLAPRASSRRVPARDSRLRLPGSGGEQQRVAIARALGNEPRLLIADEPTAQLDSRRAETIMGLLRKLVDAQGVSVIVATHDPRLIGMAHRVIELRDGAVVGEGDISLVTHADTGIP